MTVTLTPYEVQMGATVGLRRHLEALELRLPDRHGYQGDGWGIHIEGALGELALAKYLGKYWDGSVNTFKRQGDVGQIQVRTRSRDDFELLVRPDDRDEDIFVLVVGQAPRYRVVGWIRGSEAKRPEWQQTYGQRPPAYFVPQASLKPLKASEKPA